MQKKLYEDVKADPVLGKDGYNYPVWSLTYGGASGENVGLQYLKVPEDDMAVPEEFRGVTFADVANLHNYFNHPSFKFPQIIRHGEPLSRVRMCHRVAMCCIGISV